jgi:ketosteroid isomerase-like protein
MTITATNTATDNVQIVRRLRTAFEEQDATTARSLLADDFRFTSPQDDHIDREAWMRTCFPSAGHFAQSHLSEVGAHGDLVFSRYDYTLADGTHWRNMEAAVVQGGQVHEVEVYFGGRID